jgi:sugar/nucleoside kinase (ribokinase family)
MRVGCGDTFRFFGGRGEDATGALAVDFIARLPVDEQQYVVVPGATPRTDVLSDPAYDHGHGERSFINLIGAAGAYGPEHLGELFWEADIIELGGTGLVPRIHDGMTEILKKARTKGSVTFVNLVYDFRSEKARPGEKWKLGLHDDAYAFIDILVADKEEALRTSGCSGVGAAMAWFARQGVGTVVVTEGSRNIRLQSSGALFTKLEDTTLPVSRAIDEELAAHPEKRGDTTGCGDNFAGGLLASLAEQSGSVPRGKLDLREACSWAAASGGFACFTVGGAFYENRPGEKRELVEPFVKRYRAQLIEEKR